MGSAVTLGNDEFLAELSRRVAAGELEEMEVLEALQFGATDDQLLKDTSVFEVSGSRLSTVLYFVGGGIVFLGLAFLIAEEWDRLGTFPRILVTLGTGLAAFVTGVLLAQQRQLGAAGSAFFLISALMLPAGMLVAYDELGVRQAELVVAVQISAAMTAVYAIAWALFRLNLLLFFAIVFGTGLVFWSTDYLASLTFGFDRFEFSAYRVFFVGLSYVLLAHAFSADRRRVLSGWLYGFGIVAVLGAGLALGGWKPDQNVFWEAVYPGLVFAVIMLSVYLKQKSLLVFGSVFLGAYLVKITAEYFSDSLGWPLALVLVGLLLMGVGYFAVRVGQRYL